MTSRFFDVLMARSPQAPQGPATLPHALQQSEPELTAAAVARKAKGECIYMDMGMDRRGGQCR